MAIVPLQLALYGGIAGLVKKVSRNPAKLFGWMDNGERCDMMLKRLAFSLTILGAALTVLLSGAPASAQATRTWVSGVGDDANPCSRTAPCKTFAGAISKTAAGGEINVLDPGGFGALTITKAITIRADHVEAGVLVSGTNGIVVAAGPTDKVILEGLDFQGLGSGINGVNFTSGAVLIIDRCNIQAFNSSGVNVASSTTNARAVIKNSTIYFNGVTGTANTGGVTVQGNGVANIVEIIDTLIQSNQNYGVQVTGAANAVSFVRSVANPTGIASVNSGQLFSIGPSNFFATGAPNQPVINFQ